MSSFGGATGPTRVSPQSGTFLSNFQTSVELLANVKKIVTVFRQNVKVTPMRFVLMALIFLNPIALAAATIAPVVTTYEIRYGEKVQLEEPEALLEITFGAPPVPNDDKLDLYLVRPQAWTDEIPFGAELHWDYEFNVGGWRGRHIGEKNLSLESAKHYYRQNREFAFGVLEAVFEFRTKAVLRDYRVDTFEKLPPAIQKELRAIKDGTRAFVVLMKPGEFGPDAIELCVGATYEEPSGLLIDERLTGRAITESGAPYSGLPPIPVAVRKFVDNEILDQGELDRVAQIGDNLNRLPFTSLGDPSVRYYQSGGRALLTTFVKNPESKLDLVPLLHQLLIASGITRFGLTPVPKTPELDTFWNSPLVDSVLRLHLIELREHERLGQGPILTVSEYGLAALMAPYLRLDEIVVEAIGYQKGRNPLARMYTDWMEFEPFVRIPNDPDFNGASTEILRIGVEKFEFALKEKLSSRRGSSIVKSAVLIPRFVPMPNREANHGVRRIFVYQPAADRFMARGVLATLSESPRYQHIVEEVKRVDLDAHYCRDLIAGIPAGVPRPPSLLDLWGIRPFDD